MPEQESFWRTAFSRVTPGEILSGDLPRGNEGRMVEACLVACAEHSVVAPSVAAARYVASAGVPLQAAVAAGMIGLGDHYDGAVAAAIYVIARPPGFVAHVIEEQTRERPYRNVGWEHVGYDGPESRPVP